MVARNKKGRRGAGLLFAYGAGEKSRTPDLRITNALLYQLSYTGIDERRLPSDQSNILAYRSPRSAQRSSNAGSFFATARFFSVTYTGSPFAYCG